PKTGARTLPQRPRTLLCITPKLAADVRLGSSSAAAAGPPTCPGASAVPPIADWIDVQLNVVGLVSATARDSCTAEIYFLYSITSSARASRAGGTVSSSALAVLRFMTSSNSVGCSTGRSAGLVPFRILSTYVAARRNNSRYFGP